MNQNKHSIYSDSLVDLAIVVKELPSSLQNAF